MPVVLRRLKTWSHWILTADPDFERLIGQPADRRRKLYNGRIPCTLYHFAGPHPKAKLALEQPRQTEALAGDHGHSSPPRAAAGPAFGGLTAKSLEQADLFRRRLSKRARHLRRWPQRQGITCYRLYDRDVPEIPLIVERFDQYVVINQHDRPHDRTPAQQADWLDLMARVAGEVLECAADRVIVNSARQGTEVGPGCRTGSGATIRHAHHGDIEYPAKETFDWSSCCSVQEAGLTFLVQLGSRQHGLPLDQRILRQMVRQLAADRRCLVLTTGAGAIAVSAAAGQPRAIEVVSPAALSLEWARRNLQANNLSRPTIRFTLNRQAQSLRAAGDSPYDLAVIDLPAPNRRIADTDPVADWWSVSADPLVAAVLPLVSPRGIVLVYIRSKSARLSDDWPSWQVREITRQTVPDDFRNRRIHRCWRLSRS
jgi:23S rRNA (guanine2445-N2)-methyltransferase / 23S rRNA (guanine2069-N7)-methyltransferase